MILATNKPNFIPAISFWSKLKRADLFVLMDELQFHSSDLSNNHALIRSDKWLVVPCTKEQKFRKIIDVKIDYSIQWQKEIWHLVKQTYRDAPYWDSYEHIFRPVFRTYYSNLIDINDELITLIADLLDITTPIYSQSQDLPLLFGGDTEKLVFICNFFGADNYIFDSYEKRNCREMLFKQNGIKLIYSNHEKMQYSVLDYLMYHGEKVKEMI